MSRNSKIISVNTNSSISPLESLLNILPCDRPIKSIQLVENVSEAPLNFVPIHKTLEDLDADILKENILFGKKSTRYLCISKTEGLPNFVLEKISIINSNDNLANDGFISIKHTSDTNQKAWRKKQLVYKLTKTEEIQSGCITDILILSKYRLPLPEGYTYLGELEKVHLCYKVAPYKPSPEIIDFTQQIESLRIQNTNNNVYPTVNNTDHYYESLNLSYQLPSSPAGCNNNNRPLPLRKAPLPPTTPTSSQTNTGTLSHYQNDLNGIPFVLNSALIKHDFSFKMPKNNEKPTDTLEYDFNLERQVLCSTRDESRKSTSLNPFF